MLICPNCSEKLFPKERGVSCEKGHSFDKAKEGYINLLLANHKRKLDPGDNKEMINAREEFLLQGYYDFLIELIISQVQTLQSMHFADSTIMNLLDVGCGSGFYTRKIQNAISDISIVGLDISKNAIVKASKKDKISTYIVGSAFRLPVAENTVDIILNVFSPLDLSQANRVLAGNGYILKVIPEGSHMKEVAGLVYENVIPHDSTFLSEINEDENLLIHEVINIEKITLLKKETVISLINMTPYKYKFDEATLQKITDMKVTLAFKLIIVKSIVPPIENAQL